MSSMLRWRGAGRVGSVETGVLVDGTSGVGAGEVVDNVGMGVTEDRGTRREADRDWRCDDDTTGHDFEDAITARRLELRKVALAAQSAAFRVGRLTMCLICA